MISPSPKEETKGKQKTKFTPEDDRKLISIYDGTTSPDWTAISIQMGNKTSRQCRERWQNYLDPKLQKKEWSEFEDEQIMQKYAELGARWNAIARSLKGRSGNAVRNRYMMLQRRKERSERLRKNIENAANKSNTFVLPQCKVTDETPKFIDIYDYDFLDIPMFGDYYDKAIDAFASIYE